MQTQSIFYFLRAQETRLDAKLRKTENKRPSNRLMVIGIFSMKLLDKILKSIGNALWMTHLLKTSIVVTRTPLTTLRCMPKAIISKLKK